MLTVFCLFVFKHFSIFVKDNFYHKPVIQGVTTPASLPYMALAYACFLGLIFNSTHFALKGLLRENNDDVILFMPSQISLTSSVVEAFGHCLV